MRVSHLLVAAVSLCALVGCGPQGQPKVYRIAVNTTPLTSKFVASCYKDGNIPNGEQIEETNYRDEQQWVIWDGVAANPGEPIRQYLDIGAATFKLGSSPDIAVSDVIEGGDPDPGAGVKATFLGSRTRTNAYPGIPNTIESRKGTVVIKFTELGPTAVGSIALKSEYSCVGNCPMPNPTPDAVTCDTTLTFTGRRIEAAQEINYGTKGTSNLPKP